MTGADKLPDVGTTIFTVMSRRAAELGALNIGQGFPDYPIAPKLAAALAAASAGGHNQYAPMEGLVALREAIAAKLLASHELVVDPISEITVTCGATEALYSAIQAAIGPGARRSSSIPPTTPTTPRSALPAGARSTYRSRRRAFVTIGIVCARPFRRARGS